MDTMDPALRLDATAAERGIRDLMGLLALPALWAGHGGQSILEIMTDAIERIVPIRFSYSHVTVLPGQPSSDVFRVDGRVVHGEEAEKWERAVGACPDANASESKGLVLATPLGDMRIVRFNLSYKARDGAIWFASAAADFPTITQLAFLRAATSLAATGIQTARIAHEREEASRAKDEFLAMLGHELRNPLAPIVTALELIKLRGGAPLTSEYMIIERQVKHLNRLVDDLLDISRITKGKITLRKTALDLRTILQQATEDIRSFLQTKRHVLTIDIPAEPVRVFGDAVRLKQVFANLLMNAGKYTDPGGHIRLAARIQQGRVSISVRDNGAGIHPQLFPRLFTIFEQGTSTIARSGGGLGIGLAIVKSFVELHDGMVVASSDGPGSGSEFIVTLPLSIDAEDRPAEQKSKQQKAFALERILIVDDNIDALEALAICLRESGYEVAVCHDPLEALNVVESFRPTVAVLDIGLPVLDGYQLAAALRQRFPADVLRLIALTGYGQQSDVQRARSAGFDEHLVKPAGLEDLIAALAPAKRRAP